MSCRCPQCPHVAYMNNECAHPSMGGRELNHPQRPNGHFPSETPKWCPLQSVRHGRSHPDCPSCKHGRWVYQKCAYPDSWACQIHGFLDLQFSTHGVNPEGLTWVEWCCAAGLGVPTSWTTVYQPNRWRDWRDGVDPTDVRAVHEQADQRLTLLFARES